MARKTTLNGDQVGKSVGSTDWNRLKTMTEDQVVRSADADPHARQLTSLELKQFKRANSSQKAR